MTDEPIAVEVKYRGATPVRAEYFHTTLGLVKFHISKGVATPDAKFDRLHYRSLKDRFDPWVTTGDVYRTVGELPFVDRVEPPEGPLATTDGGIDR